MSEHVNGPHRDQTVLFPNTIDQYVDKENTVRFIDAFLDSLNMEKLGFKHSIPADTGRPSYNPSDMLKLYIYGYLNQVRSSRKLEKECHRNIEVMWLMKKLAPDHKTIAEFRKDNVDCIKGIFQEFVYLCRSLGLYGAQLVAIDGTKFKAVNSKGNNLNEKTVAQRLKKTEEKIAEYLKELDSSDENDSEEDESAKTELKEKLSQLEEKKQQYQQIQGQMKATGQREVSLVDPDSRLMRVNSQALEVGYNIQASVDAKQHLIVDYDVINNSTDHHQLAKDALAAKEILGVDELDVLSDKGFYVEKDIAECEDNGITVFMPIPDVLSPYKSLGVPEPGFYSDRFVYDAAKDLYVCPSGKELTFRKCVYRDDPLRGRVYRTIHCVECEFRRRCTRNKRGRTIVRSEFDGAVERLRSRLLTSEGLQKCRMRRLLSEHPFGTIKRAFNQGYVLLKGLRKVQGEVGFTMLAYNIKRAINILGVGTLISLMNP
jgi:Transposase and inactivated derivatives